MIQSSERMHNRLFWCVSKCNMRLDIFYAGEAIVMYIEMSVDKLLELL